MTSRLRTFILFIGVLPLLASAAFDDVSLTTDTVLSVSGVNVSVSGSGATIESITVGAASFDVTLATDSTITVSASSATFDTSSAAGGFSRSLSCEGGSPTMTLSNSLAGTVTVTVAVSATACTTASSGSSSSGGGGGPIGASAYAPGAEPTTTPQTTLPAIQSTSSAAVAKSPESAGAAPALLRPAPITLTLRRGDKNDEVRALQTLLATDPTIYPEGLVTGYFGPATERAVKRFQKKHGVASSGTPQTTGFGLVGPKTRAKLAEIFGGGAPEGSPAISPVTSVSRHVFASPLRRGMADSDVRELQRALNADPDTRVAESGPGSPGNETAFFGPATERAVQLFQVKHDIASPSDPGFGHVGPKTRAKLNELRAP